MVEGRIYLCLETTLGTGKDSGKIRRVRVRPACPICKAVLEDEDDLGHHRLKHHADNGQDTPPASPLPPDSILRPPPSIQNYTEDPSNYTANWVSTCESPGTSSPESEPLDTEQERSEHSEASSSSNFVSVSVTSTRTSFSGPASLSDTPDVVSDMGRFRKTPEGPEGSTSSQNTSTRNGRYTTVENAFRSILLRCGGCRKVHKRGRDTIQCLKSHGRWLCLICFQTFPRESSRKDTRTAKMVHNITAGHIDFQSGNRVWRCDFIVCRKLFNTEVDLKRHIGEVHLWKSVQYRDSHYSPNIEQVEEGKDVNPPDFEETQGQANDLNDLQSLQSDEHENPSSVEQSQSQTGEESQTDAEVPEIHPYDDEEENTEPGERSNPGSENTEDSLGHVDVEVPEDDNEESFEKNSEPGERSNPEDENFLISKNTRKVDLVENLQTAFELEDGNRVRTGVDLQNGPVAWEQTSDPSAPLIFLGPIEVQVEPAKESRREKPAKWKGAGKSTDKSSRTRFGPKAVKIMVDFFSQHQNPKSEDIDMLVEKVGMPRKSVMRWFGHQKTAMKKTARLKVSQIQALVRAWSGNLLNSKHTKELLVKEEGLTLDQVWAWLRLQHQKVTLDKLSKTTKAKAKKRENDVTETECSPMPKENARRQGGLETDVFEFVDDEVPQPFARPKISKEPENIEPVVTNIGPMQTEDQSKSKFFACPHRSPKKRKLSGHLKLNRSRNTKTPKRVEINIPTPALNHQEKTLERKTSNYSPKTYGGAKLSKRKCEESPASDQSKPKRCHVDPEVTDVEIINPPEVQSQPLETDEISCRNEEALHPNNNTTLESEVQSEQTEVATTEANVALSPTPNKDELNDATFKDENSSNNSPHKVQTEEAKPEVKLSKTDLRSSYREGEIVPIRKSTTTSTLIPRPLLNLKRSPLLQLQEAYADAEETLDIDGNGKAQHENPGLDPKSEEEYMRCFEGFAQNLGKLGIRNQLDNSPKLVDYEVEDKEADEESSIEDIYRGGKDKVPAFQGPVERVVADWPAPAFLPPEIKWTEEFKPNCVFCGTVANSIRELSDHTQHSCHMRDLFRRLEPYLMYEVTPSPIAFCKICCNRNLVTTKLSVLIDHVRLCAIVNNKSIPHPGSDWPDTEENGTNIYF